MNKQEVTVAVRQVRANGKTIYWRHPRDRIHPADVQKELPKDMDGGQVNVANQSAANAKKDKQFTLASSCSLHAQGLPHPVHPRVGDRQLCVVRRRSRTTTASKQKIDTDLIKPGALVELSGNVANLAPTARCGSTRPRSRRSVPTSRPGARRST